MGKEFFYTGSYATREQEGVKAMRLSAEDGRITERAGLAGMHHPSFLKSNAAGTRLYVVSETGEEPGSVFAYAVDAENGALALINEASTLGGSPCHIALDAAERLLIVTNYTGGTVSVYEVRGDGSLRLSDNVAHAGSGLRGDRQEGPHPHSAIFDAANRFALVADLGTDEIVHYRIDRENGKLIRHGATKAIPGAGPRHMAFNAAGDMLYVVNELDNTVCVYGYEGEDSVLTQRQVISTLPEAFAGESTCADIHVTADGRFLYASNRGHDSIAAYRIQPDGGLELIDIVSSGGRTPRNFAISPDGQYLLAANQDSDNIVAFRMDSDTGRLRPTGEDVESFKPVCVAFL
ncbi:lactonase family protein [Paenibacillus glycinis]|uniref:Beta-propeller fold lactonase family protein n=1 Tax=Paenibacillus glycinis TaxID=2697035 RepID=A0ABW9XZQ3_9BACL|nr:lactonase family protein [Paenibacillus glycinis]NBD28090.1 beta-propeller fold lactonase family protein [Paenibacillus glycinis]